MADCDLNVSLSSLAEDTQDASSAWEDETDKNDVTFDLKDQSSANSGKKTAKCN